jgi:cytochrome c biogenesis protein CcdA
LLQLAGLVVSVAFADSLNPSTIGPALYLATGQAPARKVLGFTAGVFVVFLAAGLLIALGPGELLLSVLPRPSARTKHAVEAAVGAGLAIAGAIVWAKRRALAARPLPGRNMSGGSAVLLGAGISLVELPTAVPYFVVIAAIVGAGASVPERIELLVLFCAVFCLPLLAIAAVLVLGGDRAREPLRRVGDSFHHHWPALLAALLILVGVGFGVAATIGFVRD